MKSRAERLCDILLRFHKSEINNTSAVQDTVDRIIALFKECVPENITLVELESKYDQGWRHCRTETLKNMEELR